MKKFLVVLMTLLVLCGCASNSTEIEKGNTDVEKTDLGEEGINAEVSDKEVVKGAVVAKDNSLVNRASKAIIGNTILKEFSEEEVIARSGVVEKGNSDFNDFMDFVYQALYDSVPDTANYPAVKYIVGEWTFVITAQKQILGTDFDEIGFADFGLDLDSGEMSLVLHPRILHYEDELYAEDDDEAGYLPFSGYRQENKTFLLSDYDGLMVSVRHYYEVEGHEYVRARMFISEDQYADVLFFRVQ